MINKTIKASGGDFTGINNFDGSGLFEQLGILYPSGLPDNLTATIENGGNCGLISTAFCPPLNLNGHTIFITSAATMLAQLPITSEDMMTVDFTFSNGTIKISRIKYADNVRRSTQILDQSSDVNVLFENCYFTIRDNDLGRFTIMKKSGSGSAIMNNCVFVYSDTVANVTEITLDGGAIIQNSVLCSWNAVGNVVFKLVSGIHTNNTFWNYGTGHGVGFSGAGTHPNSDSTHDPLFVSPLITGLNSMTGDPHFQATTPCKNTGDSSTEALVDIIGVARTDYKSRGIFEFTGAAGGTSTSTTTSSTTTSTTTSSTTSTTTIEEGEYTLAEFVQHVRAGDPVKVLADAGQSFYVEIGGISIKIDNDYDLGPFHTAKQVLESRDLRNHIGAGLLGATVGTINLSKEPTAK